MILDHWRPMHQSPKGLSDIDKHSPRLDGRLDGHERWNSLRR